MLRFWIFFGSCLKCLIQNTNFTERNKKWNCEKETYKKFKLIWLPLNGIIIATTFVMSNYFHLRLYFSSHRLERVCLSQYRNYMFFYYAELFSILLWRQIIHTTFGECYKYCHSLSYRRIIHVCLYPKGVA